MKLCKSGSDAGAGVWAVSGGETGRLTKRDEVMDRGRVGLAQEAQQMVRDPCLE